MDRPRYKTAFVTRGHTEALKDGTVRPRTFDFEFDEVPQIIQVFRRMVRGARIVGDSATDSVIIERPGIYENNPFISASRSRPRWYPRAAINASESRARVSSAGDATRSSARKSPRS